MQPSAQQTNSLPAPRGYWSGSAASGTRRRHLLRPLLQCFGIGLLALGSYLLFSHFLLQTVRVVGVSMVPTLHDSDNYLLNRWVFYVRAPHRSEVVVLRDPADNGCSVKRVVAEEGDTVYLKDGKVYINGQRLDEPYLASGTPTFASNGAREQLFKCAPGQYFVLGDNRTFSVDSRAYGPVPRRNILGLLLY